MPFKKGETPIGAKPFVKGQSGNPAGREKGAKTRATIARNWLEVAQTLKNPITNVTESMSQEDIMTLSLIKEAREGNVNAYKALMDSAYGAPKQEVGANHTGTVNVVNLGVGLPPDETTTETE